MRKILLCLALIMIFAQQAQAKEQKIWNEFKQAFPPAEDHRGLVNPYVAPDLSKINSYVVVLKGGIPAERAKHYIGWQDYDYRGVTIDGDKIKTRRGSIYTYLQKGDVMIVTDISRLGRTLYFKLLSADVYIPENRKSEKRHSRVSDMLGYKLPKNVYKEDNAGEALSLVYEWVKPFKNLDEAKTYAEQIKSQMTNDNGPVTIDEGQ